jgi:hypothetical protein
MKVVIYCPGNTTSGGPELLHQLCDSLIKMGIDCSILYYGLSKNRRTPEAFKSYNLKVISKPPRTSQYCLVVPEIRTDYLRRVQCDRKIIWWQSVDNYWKYMVRESRIRRVLLYSSLSPRELIMDESIYHACQSF